MLPLFHGLSFSYAQPVIIWFPDNLPATPLLDENRKLMLAFLPDNIPLRSVIKKQGFPRTLQVPHDQLRSYEALMAGLSVEENRASATESGYTNCSPNRNTWRSDGRTRPASGTWKRQPVSGRNYPRPRPPRFGKTRVNLDPCQEASEGDLWRLEQHRKPV